MSCLRSGEPQEAVEWAEQTIVLAPFRETGYRRLMEAHAAAGNRAEALRVYERCRRLLAEELGTYPSPETESIYRGLLEATGASAARSAPPLPPPQPSNTERNQSVVGPSHRLRRRHVLLAVLAVLAAAGVAAVAAVTASRRPPATPIRGDAVAIVDAASRTPRRLGGRHLAPGAIAYGAGSVWVSSPDARSITRISPGSRQVISSIPLAVPPQSLAVAGNAVWAVGSGPDRPVPDARADRPDLRQLSRTSPACRGDGRHRLSERPRPHAARRASLRAPDTDRRAQRTHARADSTRTPLRLPRRSGSGARGLPTARRTWSSASVPTERSRRSRSGGARPRSQSGKRAVWVANALDGTVKSIDPVHRRGDHDDRGRDPTRPRSRLHGDSVWVASGRGRHAHPDRRAHATTSPRRSRSAAARSRLAVGAGKVWASVQTRPPAQPERRNGRRRRTPRS